MAYANINQPKLKQRKEDNMSVAKKFLEQLQSGNINEAIETIQSGLRDSAAIRIEESRQEVLESYGFVAEGKKKKAYEKDEMDDEEDKDDDEDEEEEESENE